MIQVKRTEIRLKADPRRVVPLYLGFPEHKIVPVVDYVLSLEEKAVEQILQGIYNEFQDRHIDFEKTLLRNYQKIETYLGEKSISFSKKRLLGAYFTHEYTIEASALFNPSIVPHPDQSGLKEGQLRFIMSLRAVGEGHISSIEFRAGTISKNGAIALDPPESKLSCGNLMEAIQDELNYDLIFDENVPLSARVIFPQSKSESNGMEDARFVQFFNNGETSYLATYTAYNGRGIRPQLIETTDFKHFKIRPFYGKAVSNKGMAFFPEKINGKYAMISRQGGRNISIMYSDDLCFWEDYKEIQMPQRAWEILQMGNSGSPIKTPHGWLLLTHAVGPMRKYVLSFSLLDLNHPERVLASLDQPLMSPNEEEREGYVPNVLYTCGLLKHGGNLIIPYAMSDSATSFAVVNTKSLLSELLK